MHETVAGIWLNVADARWLKGDTQGYQQAIDNAIITEDAMDLRERLMASTSVRRYW